MGGLLAALATLAQPILARVLLALGFAAVAITGAGAVIAQLKGLVIDNLTGSPLAALQLAGLAGVWVGLGMMFGSMSFALAYWTATKAVRIAGGGA